MCHAHVTHVVHLSRTCCAHAHTCRAHAHTCQAHAHTCRAHVVHMMHMSCTCICHTHQAHVVHMHTHVMHTCHAHVVHMTYMSCTCHTHVRHMLCTCHAELTWYDVLEPILGHVDWTLCWLILTCIHLLQLIQTLHTHTHNTTA